MVASCMPAIHEKQRMETGRKTHLKSVFIVIPANGALNINIPLRRPARARGR